MIEVPEGSYSRAMTHCNALFCIVIFIIPAAINDRNNEKEKFHARPINRKEHFVHNTILQSRVVDKRQRERFFGVGDAPIVVEITAGNVRGVEEHRLERGVESAGIGYVGRRSVGRRRRGVISGHGGDLNFFYLFWVSRRSIFRREGGKNKEERREQNRECIVELLRWVYPSDAWYFGEAILEARNC
jgi:hypothetical protein